MSEDDDGPLLEENVTTMIDNNHSFDSIEKEIDPHYEAKQKKKNDFHFTSLWRKPRIVRRKTKSFGSNNQEDNHFDDNTVAFRKTTKRSFVKDRESFETTGSIPLSDFDEAKDTLPFLNFRPGLSSRNIGVNDANSEASRVLKEKTILNPKMFITPTPTKRKDNRYRINGGRISNERLKEEEESNDEFFKSIQSQNNPIVSKESPNRYETETVMKATPMIEEVKEDDNLYGKENLFQDTIYDGGDIYQDHGPILSSLSEDSVNSDSILGEHFLSLDNLLDNTNPSSDWNHSNNDIIENDNNVYDAHYMRNLSVEVQQQNVEVIHHIAPQSVAIETNVKSFSDRLKFYQSKTVFPIQHPNQNRNAHRTSNLKLNLGTLKEMKSEMEFEKKPEKSPDTAIIDRMTQAPKQTLSSKENIEGGIFGVKNQAIIEDPHYTFFKSTTCSSSRENWQDLERNRATSTRAEKLSSVELRTKTNTNAPYTASYSLKEGTFQGNNRIVAAKHCRHSGSEFDEVVSKTRRSDSEDSDIKKLAREDEVHDEDNEVDSICNLQRETNECFKEDNCTSTVERAPVELKKRCASISLQVAHDTSKNILYSENTSSPYSKNVQQMASRFGVTIKKRGGYKGKVICTAKTPITNNLVEIEGFEGKDSALNDVTKTAHLNSMKESTTLVAAEKVLGESESRKNILKLESSCNTSQTRNMYFNSGIISSSKRTEVDLKSENETVTYDAKFSSEPSTNTTSIDNGRSDPSVDFVRNQSGKLDNNTLNRRTFMAKENLIENKASENKEHVTNMESNSGVSLYDTNTLNQSYRININSSVKLDNSAWKRCDFKERKTSIENKSEDMESTKDITLVDTNALNPSSTIYNNFSINTSPKIDNKFSITSLKRRGFIARKIPIENKIEIENKELTINVGSGDTSPSLKMEIRCELESFKTRKDIAACIVSDRKSLDFEDTNPDIKISLNVMTDVQKNANKFGVTLVKQRNFNVKNVDMNPDSPAVGSSGKLYHQNNTDKLANANTDNATVGTDFEEITNLKVQKEGRIELRQSRDNLRSISPSNQHASPDKESIRNDIDVVDSSNPCIQHITDLKVASCRTNFVSISERMKMFERANTSNFANSTPSRKSIDNKKCLSPDIRGGNNDTDHACAESPKSIEISGSFSCDDPTVSTKRRSTISKIEPRDIDLNIQLELGILKSIPANNFEEEDNDDNGCDIINNRLMTIKGFHKENIGLGFINQRNSKESQAPIGEIAGYSARKYFFENLGTRQVILPRPLLKRETQGVATNTTYHEEVKIRSPHQDNHHMPMFITVEEDFLLKDNISSCLSASENRLVVCKPPDALLLSVSRKAMRLMTSDDRDRVPKVSLSSMLQNTSKEVNHYDSERQEQFTQSSMIHRHESGRKNGAPSSQQYRHCLERKATSEIIQKPGKQEISNQEKDIIISVQENIVDQTKNPKSSISKQKNRARNEYSLERQEISTTNNPKVEAIYQPKMPSSLKARRDIFQSKLVSKKEQRKQIPSDNNTAPEAVDSSQQELSSMLKPGRNLFKTKSIYKVDGDKRFFEDESSVEKKHHKSTMSSTMSPRKSCLSFEEVVSVRQSMDSARKSSASDINKTIVRPSSLLRKVGSGSTSTSGRKGLSSTPTTFQLSLTGQEKKKQYVRCF